MSSMGIAMNNEAKLKALDRGLELCYEKGIANVNIEGDSQLVVNVILKSNILSWKLKKWLPGIFDKLSRLSNYSIAHVFREGNKVANWLAGEGIKSCTREVVIDGLL
ncbi:hypothetical protein SUGI_0244350 [Cryptomeria japonica]|nr:hypothetical protein SUGI_0244350 [Cryptomeria japonica]